MPARREDVVEVAAGVHIQTEYWQEPRSAARIAFIAHPLGRLGGSYNDHVVQALADRLHKRHSYSIVLMNSRGVGSSTGAASYSGIPEAEDYQKVVDYYTQKLASTSESSSLQDILYCGYSAGSLSATMCTPHPVARTRYLLISYPLSVMWALTLFRPHAFSTRLTALARDAQLPLMFIRGDRDQFTGDSKYATWEKTLLEGSRQTLFSKIEGADHFWSDREHLRKMLDNVTAWLESNGGGIAAEM